MIDTDLSKKNQKKNHNNSDRNADLYGRKSMYKGDFYEGVFL